jgi:hypothetical protein
MFQNAVFKRIYGKRRQTVSDNFLDSKLMVTRQVFSNSKLGNVSSVEHTIGSQTPLFSKEDKGDD